MTEDPHQILMRAAHDMDIGNLGGAVEKLRDVLTIEPEHALAHGMLASCLMGQRRLHAARHEADLAIELAPEMSVSHRIRGLIALSEDDRKRAGEALRKAVELEPGEPDNLVALARFERVTGRPQTARQLAAKALEIDPSESQALVFGGEIDLETGNLAGAEAAAQAALKINAEDLDGLVLLGRIRLRQGDHEAARDLALWALQLHAEDAGALELMANLKMKENWFLGTWWRYNVWLSGLGNERAMLVLTCAFVLYSLARLALRDFGYQQYSTLLSVVWVIFCIYTWAGSGIRDKLVAKELERVRLRPEF